MIVGTFTLFCSHRACVLSHFRCVQLFVTPWTVAGQVPLSMGFSRQEHWSGLSWPPPGGLPDPGIAPASLTSSALAGGFLTTRAAWEAHHHNPTPVLLPRPEPKSYSLNNNWHISWQAWAVSVVLLCLHIMWLVAFRQHHFSSLGKIWP